MGAIHEAIATTELLEMILLEVDIKTLLLSQRVSRTFQSTITGSSKLQTKLFFKRRADPNDFVTNLPHPIATEEFYLFRIFNLQKSIKFDFLWESDLPAADRRATGSWAKMYTYVPLPACASLFYQDQQGTEMFRHVELPRRCLRFGDILEALMKAKAREASGFKEWHAGRLMAPEDDHV